MCVVQYASRSNFKYVYTLHRGEVRLKSTKFIRKSCIYKKKNDLRKDCVCTDQYSNLSGKMTGAINVQPKMP